MVVVGVEGWEGSETAPLGTVINLEPSLFVYLAVFRGDAGVWEAGLGLLAGIVGQEMRDGGSIKRLRATRVRRLEGLTMTLEGGGTCQQRVKSRRAMQNELSDG